MAGAGARQAARLATGAAFGQQSSATAGRLSWDGHMHATSSVTRIAQVPQYSSRMPANSKGASAIKWPVRIPL